MPEARKNVKDTAENGWMDISREVKEKIPTLMHIAGNPGKEAPTIKKE